jgi:phage terminase large subunit-like protein
MAAAIGGSIKPRRNLMTVQTTTLCPNAVAYVTEKVTKIEPKDVLAAGWNNDSAFVIIYNKRTEHLECYWNDGEMNAHPLFEVPTDIEAEAWAEEIMGPPEHLAHMTDEQVAELLV